MKKNTPLFGFLVAFGAVLFAFAVKKPNYYLVDNPTADTYYFQVNNGPEKIITSGQFIKVDLKQGTNTIKVADAGHRLLFDSAFTVTQPRGLVNITHHDYYIHNQYYGRQLNKDSLLLAHHAVIDGEVFPGDIRHSNKLFEENFYYNLDENYDRVIKNIQKVESRTKIYRKQDFLNFYKENYR